MFSGARGQLTDSRRVAAKRRGNFIKRLQTILSSTCVMGRQKSRRSANHPIRGIRALTWVTSRWKNPSIPGQFSAEINTMAFPGFAAYARFHKLTLYLLSIVLLLANCAGDHHKYRVVENAPKVDGSTMIDMLTVTTRAPVASGEACSFSGERGRERRLCNVVVSIST
jgi:hypothetical protein